VQREPWVAKEKSTSTLKGFTARRTLSGLQENCGISPGLSLRSNPGLQLANAFGVFKSALKLNQCDPMAFLEGFE
jgi:hypothetical protein